MITLKERSSLDVKMVLSGFIFNVGCERRRLDYQVLLHRRYNAFGKSTTVLPGYVSTLLSAPKLFFSLFIIALLPYKFERKLYENQAMQNST